MSFTSVHVEPFQDSVSPTVGDLPPNAKADVFVPAPAKFLIAVFKSPTSVQLLPFQVSLTASLVDVYPPNAKAAVLLAPAPAKESLAVFKSPVSVQLLPFHDSLFAIAGGPPPNAKADVEVPAPAANLLAVFKSPTSVQLEPLYNSLTTSAVVVYPPAAIVAD